VSAIILAILLSFGVSKKDQLPETNQERRERLEVVAVAIEETANRAACFQRENCKPIIGDRYLAAAVLIVQARNESAFRYDVQVAQCRMRECDRGRARGLWQLHRNGVPVEDWENYAGLERENVASGAWQTIKLWAGGSWWGGKTSRPECGFARLAGKMCTPDVSHSRADETIKLARKIREATR
jgi:5-enolpyruvylshikimate-3-phosphate synthase